MILTKLLFILIACAGTALLTYLFTRPKKSLQEYLREHQRETIYEGYLRACRARKMPTIVSKADIPFLQMTDHEFEITMYERRAHDETLVKLYANDHLLRITQAETQTVWRRNYNTGDSIEFEQITEHSPTLPEWAANKAIDTGILNKCLPPLPERG